MQTVEFKLEQVTCGHYDRRLSTIRPLVSHPRYMTGTVDDGLTAAPKHVAAFGGRSIAARTSRSSLLRRFCGYMNLVFPKIAERVNYCGLP
jgi:hypothetical protein